MTIDEYLRALDRRLPRIRRRRVLAEVEEHLRDAATQYETSGLERIEAEASAVRDFGDVGSVARQFAAEVAILETRLATVLALLAVAFFVFPLYVVPENTLPPASWAEKPADILVLQIVAVALWLGAGLLAGTSVVLAWTPWKRFAAPALGVVPIALAGSILVSAALVARWFVAGSGIVWWPVLAAPLAIGCLAACAETAGWAHSRRCRLQH